MKSVMLIFNFQVCRKAVRWRLIMTCDSLEPKQLQFNVKWHHMQSWLIDAWNASKNIQQNPAFWHSHILPFLSFFFSLFPSRLTSFATSQAHLPKSSPSIFASFCPLPPYCRLCGADTALLQSHTDWAGKARMPRWWTNEGWANPLMIQNEILHF